MSKISKLFIILLIIGVFSINIFVQADYDKPATPTELKSDIIKSANTILDSVYNKRTNKTKYPTLESYITYIDKVNSKLRGLKNTFQSTDIGYIIITYVTSGITNIKTSVQNEIILNPVNTNTGITQTQQESMLTLTGNQTINGIKTFSNPIVAPTPTANNQLITKDYMDNAVSAAGGLGSCDGKVLYMKYTEARYTGNLGGRSGADEKCKLEFPGSHFCHKTEIIKAGHEGCLPSTLGYFFIYGSYPTPKVDDTNDNCSNWTSEDSSQSSPTSLIPAFGHWAKQGLASCSSPQELVCCN